MTSTYELRNEALDLGEAVKAAKAEYNEVLNDPKSTVEAVQAAKAKLDNRQMKYEGKQTLIKEQEAEEKMNLKAQKKPARVIPDDPKEKMIKAEAAYIRKTVRPDDAEFQEQWNNVKQELKDDSGEDASNGNNLLPVNVSNQLVSEPLATNPLRNLESISTITNLILPVMAFEIADDNFIKDGDAAKDASLSAGVINFGRYQMKVRAGISDTILRGTDTGLVQYVNNALSSAIAKKERTVSLNPNPSGDEAHMSYYDKSNKITVKTGKDLFHAIRAALADLDDDYQDSAKILMRRPDYDSIIDALANGSTTLYPRQPEEVLGAPVTFTSAAVKPIVGDFSYARLNYEIDSSLYEQYKDYDHGINYFQFTTWFDHRIVLPSAFRIADVAGTTPSK
uniref:phage major capsid protein n=1 Tax=Lactobacillus acidophilus TaxID=1579 RepID=UPI003F54E257